MGKEIIGRAESARVLNGTVQVTQQEAEAEHMIRCPGGIGVTASTKARPATTYGASLIFAEMTRV
jgi:hypothetical protein